MSSFRSLHTLEQPKKANWSESAPCSEAVVSGAMVSEAVVSGATLPTGWKVRRLAGSVNNRLRLGTRMILARKTGRGNR